ncbi:LPXTG cell wall anchor domain-containing protein [Streptomyces sp. NPDC000410]|uniref:LPXTG cell wall anchor domain-containing protein n=1 Tax=Streptomyces sp. NPDC000410 TaxID=3154254 RepID=UPI00332C4775
MRMLTSTGALVTAAACSLLLAPSALATPPGDNGTVKIHDAATGEELRKNEPHVCTFYLDAFGFDAGQQVDWRIEAWAPTADVKGKEAESGSLALDASGHGRTADLSLPDGHYKLFWTFDGEHGSAKHKVFWTECDADDGKPGEKPDDNPGDKPGEKPGDKPGEEPSAEPSTPANEKPSTPADTKPTPAPTVNGASGDLAETGSSAPVGVLSAVAAALVAGGGYLVMRRRRAQQER